MLDMFPAVALIPLNASAAMSVRDEHPENIEVNVFVLVVAPNRPAGTFWRAVQFWKQLSAVVTLILWAKSLSGIVVSAVHPLNVLLNESAPVSPSKNPAGRAFSAVHPSKADSRLILLAFVPKMLPTDESFVQSLNAIL